MSDWISSNMDGVIAYAPIWGFLIIFLLMAVESSFIPFPSEVVMIPAGFLAFRGELTTHNPCLDVVLAFVCGLAGSMVGAYINYWLAVRLGRPFLYKYGKYVLLKESALKRSEEIFNRYGDVTTVVCRLLPAIRQLISIPAGLCRMSLWRFSLFTALGAGFWCIVLLAIGWALGHAAGDIPYPELVERGKVMLNEHYGKLLAALAVFVVVYLAVQHRVMKSSDKKKEQSEE